MKDIKGLHYPTPEILVTKLKSQGFFDKTRKCCLESVENNSDYLYLKHEVDGIVSKFLSDQCATGNKLELREKLRRRLQGDSSFQRSLRQMSDLLLATHASPESLAPSINQMTCNALNVDYQEWLKMSQERLPSQPIKSASPIKRAEVSAPLLPSPFPIKPKKEPLLPTSATLHTSISLTFDLTNQERISSDENEVEMEVDDGDEMEVG